MAKGGKPGLPSLVRSPFRTGYFRIVSRSARSMRS